MAAFAFWSDLPADLKADDRIKKLGETLSYNVSVDYHNRFATFMNQGDTDRAKAVLREGLSRFPQSTLLRQDEQQLGLSGQ